MITAGTATASDGASDLVALSLSGQSGSNGPTQSYQVRAINAAGASVASTPAMGSRGSSALSYQWERSLSDADYEVLRGATGATFEDSLIA